jgi:hypothetical protein
MSAEPMSPERIAKVKAYLAWAAEDGMTVGDIYARDLLTEIDRLNAEVTSLLHHMATVARHIEDGEYGDADKAARDALGVAPGVDLPGR